MSNCIGCGAQQEGFPIVIGRTNITFCNSCQHKLAIKCIKDMVQRQYEWNDMKKHPQGSDLVNRDKIIIDIDWKKVLK